VVKDICCGGFHTLALIDTGDVYSWGKGEFGQLGVGSDSNAALPRLISALHDVGRVAAISAGENHSVVATVTGDVYSWGYGKQGQLGHATGRNEKLPRLVQTLSQSRVVVVQVACGWRHSMALSNGWLPCPAPALPCPALALPCPPALP
jgi:RCC1 and BTB domain-containing protein